VTQDYLRRILVLGKAARRNLWKGSNWPFVDARYAWAVIASQKSKSLFPLCRNRNQSRRNSVFSSEWVATMITAHKKLFPNVLLS
jgi:hypothetical protein